MGVTHHLDQLLNFGGRHIEASPEKEELFREI